MHLADEVVVHGPLSIHSYSSEEEESKIASFDDGELEETATAMPFMIT